MEFFTDIVIVSQLNLRLQIWGRQLFHVLVVNLRHVGVTCNKRFSPNCSLIISLRFGICLVPLAVCIDVKHIKFHFVNLLVIIVFEPQKPSWI